MLEIRSMEKTLALIKPDAVKAGKTREILQWIEREGFAILAQRKMLVRAFHKGQDAVGDRYAVA